MGRRSDIDIARPEGNRMDAINSGPLALGFSPGTLKVEGRAARDADGAFAVTYALAYRPWGWPIDCPPAAGPVITADTAAVSTPAR